MSISTMYSRDIKMNRTDALTLRKSVSVRLSRIKEGLF